MTNDIIVPLYPAIMAVYHALKDGAAGDVRFFDGGTSDEEIEAEFRNQATFFYGIIGAAEADQRDGVDDIWDVEIQLEIYSNYSGRKIVTQKLQAVQTYLCQAAAWDKIESKLLSEDFTLISISIGSHRINQAIFGEAGVWQNGSVPITLKLNQVIKG